MNEHERELCILIEVGHIRDSDLEQLFAVGMGRNSIEFFAVEDRSGSDHEESRLTGSISPLGYIYFSLFMRVSSPSPHASRVL